MKWENLMGTMSDFYPILYCPLFVETLVVLNIQGIWLVQRLSINNVMMEAPNYLAYKL